MRLCSLGGAFVSPAGKVPQTERVAVARRQGRLCFHRPLESDAREEKNSCKFPELFP